MLVRVVRVPALPGGISIFVDDHPDGLILWVLQSEWPELTAMVLELALNVTRTHWTRNAATAMRASLRAV